MASRLESRLALEIGHFVSWSTFLAKGSDTERRGPEKDFPGLFRKASV